MNLWLRVLHLIITSFFRPRLDPVRDVSRLTFRVWPHDLDTSLHMNNGRYWTLMDLGRTDIMIRSGLWRPILEERLGACGGCGADPVPAGAEALSQLSPWRPASSPGPTAMW